MQSKIEQQVMASVGLVYTARQLVSATALKLYMCALSLYGLVQLVWVHRVFENWSQVGLGGSAQFLTYALLHTHLAVQLTLVVLVVAGAGLMRDLVRSAVSTPAFAY